MRHNALIETMSLAEKAALLSGKTVWETRDIPRLNIPSIFCSDGPHGIRKQAGAADHLGLNPSAPATCFPTAATIANSWNTELSEAIGEALGKEARSQQVHVLLGPGLNMKRSPLCGRNFEYYSEDPYHAGKMAAACIKGIQSKGVYACPKHFAVNSQELRRMVMNAVLDERTLREIYLTGFEIAVKEGHAKAIMTSYNEVNGIYANENKHLLKEILRKEWGFDGIVITDWGGSNDHVRGVAAGSTLEMPSPGLGPAGELVQAVREGRLSMADLDACVDDLLDAVISLSQKKVEDVAFSVAQHHQLSCRAAEESIVLLQNTDRILPLKPGTRVALIGDFAYTPRYQGAGSSMVHPTSVESMTEAVLNYNLDFAGSARGYQRDGEDNEALKKEALDLAKTADVVIYCFGLNEICEVEGLDRTHMRIPQNQISLLEDLVKVNPRLVGVISAGSAIEMPWHGCLKGILHGYLSGQAGATAMMNVITGKVNPSGRLSETYPRRYEDTPAFRHFPGTERNAEYREGLYIGYRYYDTGKIRVHYPFGYGLSYTTFAYSDLHISPDFIGFSVENTGDTDGAEVVQLYVGLQDARVFRPERELKGFQKVFLKAGERKTVKLCFDAYTFRYWNEKTAGWEIEAGTYTLMIGASVADIRLTGELFVAGTTTEYPYDKAQLPSYYSGLVQEVKADEFARLLGHPIPDGTWSGELGINDALCQMYYAKSRLARLVYRILTYMKKRSEQKGNPDLNILYIYNMPFRGIAKMTNGMVSMDMVEGLVKIVNGQFIKGTGQVCAAYIRNRRENKRYERYLRQPEIGKYL